MNKETLRMQMLAGVITESQYKQRLNENQNSQEYTVENVGYTEDEDPEFSELISIKLTDGSELVSIPEEDATERGTIEIKGYDIKPGDKISFDVAPNEFGEVLTDKMFINGAPYKFKAYSWGNDQATLTLVK